MIRKILILIILVPIALFLFFPISQALSQNDNCLAMNKGELSKEDVKILEGKVATDPEDLSSRTQLLEYYFVKSFGSDAIRKARQGHILWIIQNRPNSEIAGLPYASLVPGLDEEVYLEAKVLWLKQVEVHEKNAVVLGNAANFFFVMCQ